MEKGNVLSCLSLSVILILMAAVPKVLNYQGKLLDSDGVGVNATLNMTFKLYTTETGGTAIWMEEHNEANAVPVSKGLFSVELGSIVPFPPTVDFSTPYWLEIVVNGETMGPREKLTSAPYSIRSEYSEYTEKAIQSVHTPEDTTARTGRLVFRAGEGATLSDGGDSITIIVGGASTTPNIFDVLDAGNNAGGQTITNIGTPTDASDVATKGYVDANFAGSSGNNNYIQNQDTTDQSASLRISGSGLFGGNVGIGTESPTEKLNVIGDILLGDGTWAERNISLNDDNWGISVIDSSGTSDYLRLKFHDADGSAKQFQIYGTSDSTALLVVDAEGNVGIGTTSPSEKLDVEGDLRVTRDLKVDYGDVVYLSDVAYSSRSNLYGSASVSYTHLTLPTN